jgi:hypothetical protein
VSADSDIRARTRQAAQDASDYPEGQVTWTAAQCAEQGHTPDDHYASHDDARPVQHPEESVCWLLDVRKYGLIIANEMHRERGWKSKRQ